MESSFAHYGHGPGPTAVAPSVASTTVAATVGSSAVASSISSTSRSSSVGGWIRSVGANIVRGLCDDWHAFIVLPGKRGEAS